MVGCHGYPTGFIVHSFMSFMHCSHKKCICTYIYISSSTVASGSWGSIISLYSLLSCSKYILFTRIACCHLFNAVGSFHLKILQCMPFFLILRVLLKFGLVVMGSQGTCSVTTISKMTTSPNFVKLTTTILYLNIRCCYLSHLMYHKYYYDKAVE